MKINKYLLVSSLALLALLVSACASAVTESPAQPADPQTSSVVEVSSQANTEPQPVSDAPSQKNDRRGGSDLTAAAETLGITVEELEQALQGAIPAECAADTSSMTEQNGKPNKGAKCRPDLTIAAQTLGITADELQAALGGPRQGGRGERDLTAAAETLGVTVEELEQALEDAKLAECAAPTTDSIDQSGQPDKGLECRPDLTIAAETLGVTVEELQSALGKPPQMEQAPSQP